MNTKDKENKAGQQQRQTQTEQRPGYQKEQDSASRQSDTGMGSRQSERQSATKEKQLNKEINKDKPQRP